MHRYHEGLGHGGPMLGWLAFLVVLVVLVGLAVWAVRRITSTPAAAAPQSGATTPRPDPALEAARMRYARGEIGRDDYLRIAADLGSPPVDPGASSSGA
jgi:putative membrane protein